MVCRLIRATVYPSLKDHASVNQFPRTVPGMEQTLFFFDHDHPEAGLEDGKSKSNVFEAQFAIHLAMYLMKQDHFAAGNPRCVFTRISNWVL